MRFVVVLEWLIRYCLRPAGQGRQNAHQIFDLTPCTRLRPAGQERQDARQILDFTSSIRLRPAGQGPMNARKIFENKKFGLVGTCILSTGILKFEPRMDPEV